MEAWLEVVPMQEGGAGEELESGCQPDQAIWTPPRGPQRAADKWSGGREGETVVWAGSAVVRAGPPTCCQPYNLSGPSTVC